MTIKSPCVITSSLTAGVRIGNGEVCIEYSRQPGREGRTRYKWTVNLPDGTHHAGHDLQSGCCGGDLREGLESLLSFLGAAAESYNYKGLDGENADLFPQPVVEWAAAHSDEIAMLQYEVEETEDCIVE